MKNTFNSGGGGIAIGSNSVATGSNSIYSSVANHGENIKTADLSDNQILQLIKNFEDLKTVVFAKIEDQSDAVALQITALEQKIIKKEPVEHKMLGRVLSSVTDLSKAVPSVAEAVSAILKILLP